MIWLYNEIIYRPLLNILVFFYNVIPGHDMGVVIILVTILIRLLLFPFTHKTLKHQEKMQELQPKLKELQDKHKDDKQAQAQAVMNFYKENEVNSLGSCLPILIQLPIFIALYQVFSHALAGSAMLDGLYSFIQHPEVINPKFLNLIDLSHSNPLLAILSGLAQFWQSRLMLPAQSAPSDDVTVKALQWQTTYFLPIISIVIAWNLPAGLPLYWIVTTLFGIGQQYYIRRQKKA
jgi:YidC/Oxa1 family membrane protein insertase